MDGAKPSSISTSELYGGFGTTKAPLAVDAQLVAGADEHFPENTGTVRLNHAPSRSSDAACKSTPASRGPSA
jgi:hypothetical protein